MFMPEPVPAHISPNCVSRRTKEETEKGVMRRGWGWIYPQWMQGGGSAVRLSVSHLTKRGVGTETGQAWG